MHRALTLLIALGFALPAVPLPARGQDASGDWDLQRDSRGRLTSAYVAFDSGIAVMVRCNRHAYEAVIAGLPAPPAGKTRTLRIGLGEEAPTEDTWLIGVDRTLAVASYPAPFARDLRDGGHMTLIVPGAAEGGRNLRYELDLPASSTAIDETLTACERPLVDPRDASLADIPASGMTGGMTWVRVPAPKYPETTYVSGAVVLTCLNRPDGGLGDCVVESEYPVDGGFGEAALRSARNARVRDPNIADGPIPVRQIGFRVNFTLAN